ncbi:NAD(P)-binding protein [Sodiomyces alkalinus F11]|uniref:NAD(P)-binding protein n=1 Tax=Sodiomyces alkalinus (strain CBS 110278 / VKM F-3762 / F11) TaxID=1314773 RepID=A0A3N2Q5X5_SODAK|nr:NAD(P)-binding protein [Sodiomyces alkalinus F11]ROT42140.1 NAD(P)-binding protein [Sodiomyces alkalinus F11]
MGPPASAVPERKGSDPGQASRQSNAIPPPQFPTHNSPRTWFVTHALSPLVVRLIRLLLAHGDYVVACLPPHEMEDDDRSADFRDLVTECKSISRRDREGWKDRLRAIRCDGRESGQCIAAVAEAHSVFGRIDILLCCGCDSIVGTVEELTAGPPVVRNLVRDQFETIFFAHINFIKAALPRLRAQHTGHIIALTSIGGHIGTPGFPISTSATWALEGYCDSLAYEVAPFNIKVTIVQPNKEVQTLTNRIVFAPPLPTTYITTNIATTPTPATTTAAAAAAAAATASTTSVAGTSALPPTAVATTTAVDPDADVDPDVDPDADLPDAPDLPDVPQAPSVRDMLTEVLNANPDTALDPDSTDTIQYRYPRLPPEAIDRLVTETVHALVAIGGHENPPARHIVGFEGSTAVKEKLKTVTEELEDFVEASVAVDIFESELKSEARAGGRRAVESSPAAPGSTTSG